jgi:hypothetical protein
MVDIDATYKKQTLIGLTVAQSLFRRKMQRRSFLSWKRKQLHVVVIEIEALPSHFSAGWVTLTIIDPVRSYQILKFDKKHDKCYEEGI